MAISALPQYSSKHETASPLVRAHATKEDSMDVTSLSTARNIMGVLSRYRLDSRCHSFRSEEGDLDFVSQIYRKVTAGQPITMCLPAFPFKSPNSKSKILGHLPDKAEEFALAHLNGMCAAIQDIYPPGSTLFIISDGLVYNDLLGVPDKNVWAYGEELRAMSAAKFEHIRFSRLKDLVDVNVPDNMDEIAYVSNATNFRLALLQKFGNPNFDVNMKISEDEDTCLTYRGYLKFLETDLQTVYPIGKDRSKNKYKKGVSYIAKQMLYRGDAFSRAVHENFPDHFRLSIHPSTGDNKLSVSLMSTDSTFTTPWHSCIAFRLDGTITTGPRASFEGDDMYELVEEDGRPSYFREKSALLSWGENRGGIVCEPLYPSGIMIHPAAGRNKMNIDDVDAAKVRALSELNSPVVLRGFAQTTNRDLFVAKAEKFGKPLPWKFGLVLEVKDYGSDTKGLNNVLSSEWMPFHYDGLFKTEKRVNADGREELVSTPPRFQLFTGVTDSPKNTGFTLFSSSTLLSKYLPSDLPLQTLRQFTWGVSTSSFDATKLRGLPLVVDHPTSGQPCIRYHEPWPQTKTKFEPTLVTIEDADGPRKDNAAICDTLDSLLHDRRVAYWHSWQKGDMLISDNILTMHTRSDFTAGSDRELWRIHFD